MEDSELWRNSSRREVLQGLSLTSLAMTDGISGIAVGQELSVSFDRRFWWRGDYRIVQTNLREIDVRENPRDIARAIKNFGGNVIISNIGGIVSFYPTKLELQYQNPYLQGDFVKEMIQASHAEGLAYVGRFDLSKAMKTAYDAHPDWFMLNRTGEPREYEGTYQACPNGGWAQDYGLRILEEALTQYRPDGLFFNMVGYPSTDYSNINHGICVCDNCKRVFREMFGRDLPRIDGFSDSAWRDYLDFQERTNAVLAAKVLSSATSLIPGIAIIRSDDYELVGRGEIQRRVDRPAPEWAYYAGEQCRTHLARNPGKPWSSTSTAHIDYPWRQVTETAAHHQLRFAQMLGVGAKLDLYLMGTLSDQDDQTYLPPLSNLFKWQAENGAHYADMAQAARVGLYYSQSTDRLGGMTPYRAFQTGSFRGAYSALVDFRIPFQFVSDKSVADGTAKLIETFDVIIAPNVMLMSPVEAPALDNFVRAGGLLITSGMTAGFDARGEPVTSIALTSFPLQSYGNPSRVKGWTYDPTNSELKVTGRVPIDAFYFGGPPRKGVTNLMPFAPDQRYGPPEFAYAIPGTAVRTAPGVSVLGYGKGHTVHIPWLIEWQYYRDGLPVHQQIIASLISRYAPAQTCTLAGAGAAELMYLRRNGAGPMLLHIINYTGQRNGLYAPAPKLHDMRIGIRGISSLIARALVSGQSLKGVTYPSDPERTWFELPPVSAFEAIFIEA